ncbi:winged helix-turn-helix domain-containing protein [Haloarchaeobius amylolyticus]|uniref:winged helix-turn-helix domain-containing protein n=1 Tax=Haloarchaeobius amylolyticus TaxID=1198296 RepID=UPI00226E3E65|nr:helix-turn-helix domain-containing protein [Haloarchaeobius amylolyticus]
MDDADATDALEVLGNELRMRILRELAAAEEPLPFSTLRERAGIRDTGKFNYHLTRLCEYYVREVADGYELGHAGTRVIAAAEPMQAEDGDAPATDAASDACPVCGDDDCERLFHVHLTPPWA